METGDGRLCVERPTDDATTPLLRYDVRAAMVKLLALKRARTEAVLEYLLSE